MLSVKQAIGEEKTKEPSGNSSSKSKSLDINKVAKQIYNLISNIDSELKVGSGKVFKESSIGYLKESVKVLKKILD